MDVIEGGASAIVNVAGSETGPSLPERTVMAAFPATTISAAEIRACNSPLSTNVKRGRLFDAVPVDGRDARGKVSAFNHQREARRAGDNVGRPQ